MRLVFMGISFRLVEVKASGQFLVAFPLEPLSFSSVGCARESGSSLKKKAGLSCKGFDGVPAVNGNALCHRAGCWREIKHRHRLPPMGTDFDEAEGGRRSDGSVLFG